MQCPQCQHANPAGARFCNACATPLAARCPSCATENPSGAQFCHQCATSLTVFTSVPHATQPETPIVFPDDHTPPGQPPLPTAERRQLTVMFCDLVGSTPLSGQVDPEVYRDVVRAYQQTCSAVIQRFGGYIAQHLGDALLVYFGYPQAHEDDAQRAVYAALGMLDAMQGRNVHLAQDQGIRLSMRIGMHTGLTVVGDVGTGPKHELLALGEAPNIASRIQGVAAPDTIAISQTTYRLIEGYFTCQPLGRQALKGVSEPMPVYRVLGASTTHTRFEVATIRGLTPLVGRADDIALLQRRWKQSRQGHGQVVLLSGEAGIGKSRLAEVVREHVAREDTGRITFRCSPYHRNSALYPVIEHVQRLAGWQRHDSPDVRLDKLEQLLQATRFPLNEAIPLMAALLSVPLRDRYTPLRLTPERHRQQTLDTLVAWLLEETTRHPVLLLCEDLHWADPSTIEVLSLLIEQTATARLLVLLTFRPTFHLPWPMAAHLTHLTLNRLTAHQIEFMATQVAGGKALPPAVMQQVVTRTDGVPLFVEEVTKAVLESGAVHEVNGRYELAESLSILAIPATLNDSLMARLDHLSSAKGVAQLAATIGRQCSYEMLQAVSQLDAATLQRELGRLVEAEILYQRGLPPQAMYSFKHALIQDAAYQALLKSTRQQYHRQIAEVLAAQFPETMATQPELLAHHYTEAGLTTQALDAWQRAGRLASERSAHQEAIAHLTRGLALIEHLPSPQDRVQRELPLQLTLGATLVKAKGHGSPEVEQVYTRARALCQQVGDSPQLARVLYGLMGYYVNRAAHQTSLEISEQLLAVAERQQDQEQLLMAHNAMGTVLYYLGEFPRAHAHLEQGILLHDVQQPRAEGRSGVLIPRVANLMYIAWTLWPLGYPEQALTRSREALALAQKRTHPFSITMALLWTSCVYQWRGDFQASHEHIEAAYTLAAEHEFTWWLAMAEIYRGWVLAGQGQLQDGIAHMKAGMPVFRNHGSEVGRSAFHSWLAEAYGRTGRVDEGLSLLVETLALVHQTQERYWEAELHRLKGELLLGQAVPDEYQAEACFQQALEIARRQQAKSWELRAATSLSRLWQRQSKHAEARELLASVYHWFTEGFDTTDLREANALLDELA